MVVGGSGRAGALEDGPLRDPLLEDDPRVVSTITTAGVVEEKAVRVFEVDQEQAYYPKREELFDADDVILFEHVSADVVFEPPPELAAWLLETETSQASSPPVDEPQVRAWRPPSLPSLAVSATLLTAAGLSLRMRLRRRARVQRANLSLALDRLDSGYKACAGDPARVPGMSQGPLRDRKAKVQAQLALARGVMAIDLAKPETQLAFVRGVMAKNLGATYQSHPRIVWRDDALKPAAEKLSRRLARLERADNELEIMIEAKRVIDRIDAGDLFCEDQAGGRFPPADDGGLGRRRGKGGDSDADDDDDDGGGVVQPPRLAKRAKALRDAPTVDDSGEARKSLCVFPEELDQCCADLEEKELFATDTVKEGLEGWDLTKVDGALAKLKLLGRSDLATKFRDNRQQVRTKIERLRNELKKPQGSRRTDVYVSSLMHACVKAETFSATDLPEYETAKLALEDARTNELRAEAQRTLAAHMVTAEPRLVKRLVAGLGLGNMLTLQPRDLQDDYLESKCGVVSSDDVVSSAGGGEWSTSVVEDGVEHVSSSQSEGRNNDGGSSGGEACAESAFSRGSPFVAVGGGADTPSSTIVTYRPTTVTNRVAAETVREQKLSLRSAVIEINACKTRLDERYKKECSKIRMDLEGKEREEAANSVRFAQQEAANSIRERDLGMTIRAAEAAEKERERVRSEAERKKVDDRRRSLRSADNDFFRLLGLTSAILTSAAVAAQKGVSLSSSAPLDIVWRLVTAECREGGWDGGALACDPTSATCGLACPLASSAGSGSTLGYGDSCAVGSGDAVAGSDGGYLGGVASADTFLWWVVSAAGSATGAVTKAGGSVVGWLLGEALGLVIPGEQCEVFAVISLVLWLCSLFVVMKVTGLVAGEVQGPVGAAIRSIVFALWVWGRFHEWLLTTSQEVLLLVAPAPALVLAYAGALRWFEQKPESCWRVGGCDMRPVVSRVMPAAVACAVALLLGAQAS